jgi:hypothetical protein
MAPNATQLAEFCLEEVGAALRTVIAYDEVGFQPEYVREDLAAAYSHRRFAALVAVARDIHGPLRLLPDEETDAPIGPYRATRHRFGNAAVLQLLEDDERGYLISVDREEEAWLDDLTGPILRLLDRE